MKPLKKEWDETVIAPQFLWQTRSRAWQELQNKRRRRRLGLAAVGALATVTAMLFLWAGSLFMSPTAPAEVAATDPQSPVVAEQNALEPESAALQPAEPGKADTGRDAKTVGQPDRRVPQGGQGKTTAATQPAMNPQPEAPADPKLDRLVMTFRLPQSGVRMIWIQQRTPPPSSGGTGL